MMKSFDPKELSLGKLHGILLGTIGPRPIAFASTIDVNGNPNLAPFSYFNVFSANPPVLIFSPARRGTDNSTKHTLENVREVPEVVINTIDFDMVEQMSLASSDFPKGINEFAKAGFDMEPSQKVKPYRVKNAPAQYECTVKEIVELGKENGAGNLIICEVVKLHIRPDILDENLHIDQRRVDMIGRMGGNYYSRAHGDALFEITKPTKEPGLGIDQIPMDIRNSEILSGNDLGKLGTFLTLPDETAVNEYRLMELSSYFVELESQPKQLEEKLHAMAKDELKKGNLEIAWKILLSFNN